MTETPLSDKAIAQFDAYMAAVRARLNEGRRSYGDSSFEIPLPQLVQEIQQELLDVTGWAFVLYSRVAELEAKVKELSGPHRPTQDAKPAPAWAPA